MKKLVLLFLLISSTVFAADKVLIEADSVETPEESVYHATGNVKVFQGPKTMLADEIFYNKTENKIHAIGNVQMIENGQTMNCTEMDYDAEKESGVFFNADAFLPPYQYIRASKITKFNEFKYNLQDARFTTCEGDKPDWSFKASEADITVGGYLKSWHTTGRVKSVPVFYTPYFIYPVKTERESGFLVPNFGYNSDIGAYIQPRYFWNIDVDQDATFALLYPTIGDPLTAVEHRYTPNSDSDIYTYLEYTQNDKIYPENRNGAYHLAKESGRYFLYNTADVKIADNFYFRSSIETVSDYDYLDDYEAFNQMDDYSNTTDLYDTNLTFNYYSRLADVDFKYLDEMQYSVGGSYQKEHTYTAPRLSLTKNITMFPIYMSYYFGYDNIKYTKYNYAYASNTEYSQDTTLEREHFNVKFYKPIDLYIMTFTPSIKLYQTRWHNLKNYPTIPDDDEISSFASIKSDGDGFTRNTYVQQHTLKLNEIYKQYSGFKHSIYNSLIYSQAPNLDQTEIASYIYDDHISWQKYYAYELTNYFDAPSWKLTITNSQNYIMTRKNERFEDFISEVALSTNVLNFSVKNEYNRYEKDSDYLAASVNAKFNNYTVYTNYHFNREGFVGYTGNVSIDTGIKYTGKKYDLEYIRSRSGKKKKISADGLDTKTDTFKVLYKRDCWAFGVNYIRETDPVSVDINKSDSVEHTILFTINLRGLGEYGLN